MSDREREDRLYVVTRKRSLTASTEVDAYGPFSWDQAKAARRQFSGFAPKIHLLRDMPTDSAS